MRKRIKTESYVVIAQCSDNEKTQVLSIKAETLDDAYHHAEITCRWGAIVVIQEGEIRTLVKTLMSALTERGNTN